VHQLSIWDLENPRNERLTEAIHQLEDRFGAGIISRGMPGQKNNELLADSKPKQL